MSDNLTGADNQQERPSLSDWLDAIPRDLGNWVAGFVDGEGSFNIPIRRLHNGSSPWRLGASFNVSQLGQEIPDLLRSIFEAGTVRGRGDGVYYFEVTKLTSAFGATAGFAAIMVWMYWTSLTILVGAQVGRATRDAFEAAEPGPEAAKAHH